MTDGGVFVPAAGKPARIAGWEAAPWLALLAAFAPFVPFAPFAALPRLVADRPGPRAPFPPLAAALLLPTLPLPVLRRPPRATVPEPAWANDAAAAPAAEPAPAVVPVNPPGGVGFPPGSLPGADAGWAGVWAAGWAAVWAAVRCMAAARRACCPGSFAPPVPEADDPLAECAWSCAPPCLAACFDWVRVSAAAAAVVVAVVAVAADAVEPDPVGEEGGDAGLVVPAVADSPGGTSGREADAGRAEPALAGADFRCPAMCAITMANGVGDAGPADENEVGGEVGEAGVASPAARRASGIMILQSRRRSSPRLRQDDVRRRAGPVRPCGFARGGGLATAPSPLAASSAFQGCSVCVHIG